jgi:hypothetical protein
MPTPGPTGTLTVMTACSAQSPGPVLSARPWAESACDSGGRAGDGARSCTVGCPGPRWVAGRTACRPWRARVPAATITVRVAERLGGSAARTDHDVTAMPPCTRSPPAAPPRALPRCGGSPPGTGWPPTPTPQPRRPFPGVHGLGPLPHDPRQLPCPHDQPPEIHPVRPLPPGVRRPLLDGPGPASQQSGAACDVAPGRVRQAYGELCQAPPQGPLLLGARFPGVLEDLVCVERLSGVQELLCLGDGLLGGADDALGLAGHAVRVVRQGAPEPVPRAGVACPALAVPVPCVGLPF